MKPLVSAVAVLAALAATGCAPQESVSESVADDTSMTLYQAIQDGAVSATFSGNGASSGDAVTLRIQKTASAPSGSLRLSVPPGSLLRSQDPSMQDMVVGAVRGRDQGDSTFIEEPEIVLSDSTPVTYILSAYCANFEKDNPSAENGFILVDAPDPVLACIVGEDAELSINAIQAAVWIQTDTTSFSQMSERFAVSDSEWTSANKVIERCYEALATRFLETARALRGDAEAQHILGVRYATGAGVPQDYVQAHMWVNLAASRMASGVPAG